MLTLTLEGMTQLDTLTFGPAPYFKVCGHFLLEGPTDTVLGCHACGYWKVQGTFFIVYEIIGNHFIHFTDGKGKQSARHGPFEKTRVADGHLAATGLVACYLPDQDAWHCSRDNLIWPEILFTVL